MEEAASRLRVARNTTVGALAWAEDDTVRPVDVPRGGASASHAGGAVDNPALRRKPELEQQRRELIASAEAKLAATRGGDVDIPCAREEATQWVSGHIVEFRARTKEAREQRRKFRLRMWPREDLHPPTVRTQPPAAQTPDAKHMVWLSILQRHTGYHALDTTTAGVQLFWLLHHRGTSWMVW